MFYRKCKGNFDFTFGPKPRKMGPSNGSIFIVLVILRWDMNIGKKIEFFNPGPPWTAQWWYIKVIFWCEAHLLQKGRERPWKKTITVKSNGGGKNVWGRFCSVFDFSMVWDAFKGSLLLLMSLCFSLILSACEVHTICERVVKSANTDWSKKVHRDGENELF